jgi:hypothetical protein
MSSDSVQTNGFGLRLSLLARVGLTPHEPPASIRVLGTERRHDPGGRVLVK